MLSVWLHDGGSCQTRSHTEHCRLLNLQIIPKTFEPHNFWLSSKPGHLPLRIVTMCLLGSLHRLLSRDFSTQKLRRLLVAERSQWPRAGAIFLDQAFVSSIRPNSNIWAARRLIRS